MKRRPRDSQEDKPLAFDVRAASRNVHVVRVRWEMTPGWEQWFLLRADAHHDNLHCDHALEKKHLELAAARGAGVLDFGDLHCLMQGKYDKRADKTQVRPEHNVNNYRDAVLQSAVDFYEPYARNWVLMTPGNHETSVIDRHGVDMTQQLAAQLRERTGHRVHTGGYSGYVRFHFVDDAKHAQSKILWYHHGYGGGGAVTKDIIQVNRKAVYISDADFVVSGHTHDEWIFPITRIKLGVGDDVVHTRQYHIKVPGYKNEYKDGFDGWHVQRGGPPKPQGAAWLRFYHGGPERGVCSEVLLTGES